ncbi:hypothetical protein [Xanthomonas sp. LMG 12462]|uniref:hypothetical protein n=1 Tax=Xanthomonas sp. LMG 12462 TaxID=1591134 RepID=UPI00186B323A|nr:hypothetical protein [Xanthomonas sp. LMG 12462]
MINVSDDTWKNETAIRRLPSVELQFFAWVQLVDDGKISRCIDLRKRGYNLYIRRSTCWSLPLVGRGATTLDVASVFLAPKLRGNGWFKCFLDLADQLVPWDAIYVQSVQNPKLGSYLLSTGFIDLGQDNFYRPTRNWRAKYAWDDTSRELAAAEALASRPVTLPELAGLADIKEWPSLRVS